MRLPFAMYLLFLTACSDPDPDHVSGQTLCDDICARQTRCSDDGMVTCDTKCPAQAALVRAEALDALDSCYLDLACSESDDQCVQEAEDAVGQRASDTAFQSACTAKHDACEDAFGDDLCFESFLYEEDTVATLQGCLDLDCGAVQDCLNEATAR